METMPTGKRMTLPKHAELWLAPYLRNRLEHALNRTPPKRLWVSLTDHWEPWGGKASEEVATARVKAWTDHWPHIAWDAPPDAIGRPPCYTFFYPQEEYHPKTLAALEPMVADGVVDVEVHIHHEHDTAETFSEKIRHSSKKLLTAMIPKTRFAVAVSALPVPLSLVGNISGV